MINKLTKIPDQPAPFWHLDCNRKIYTKENKTTALLLFAENKGQNNYIIKFETQAFFFFVKRESSFQKSYCDISKKYTFIL